jgi:hypothetical protein
MTRKRDIKGRFMEGDPGRVPDSELKASDIARKFVPAALRNLGRIASGKADNSTAASEVSAASELLARAEGRSPTADKASIASEGRADDDTSAIRTLVELVDKDIASLVRCPRPSCGYLIDANWRACPFCALRASEVPELEVSQLRSWFNESEDTWRFALTTFAAILANNASRREAQGQAEGSAGTSPSTALVPAATGQL